MKTQKQRIFSGLYLFVILALLVYFSSHSISSLITFARFFISSNDYLWLFLSLICALLIVSIWILAMLNLLIKTTTPPPEFFKKKLSKNQCISLIIISSIAMILVVGIIIYCIHYNYEIFIETLNELSDSYKSLYIKAHFKQLALNILCLVFGLFNYLIFIIPFVKCFKTK